MKEINELNNPDVFAESVDMEEIEKIHRESASKDQEAEPVPVVLPMAEPDVLESAFPELSEDPEKLNMEEVEKSEREELISEEIQTPLTEESFGAREIPILLSEMENPEVFAESISKEELEEIHTESVSSREEEAVPQEESTPEPGVLETAFPEFSQEMEPVHSDHMEQTEAEDSEQETMKEKTESAIHAEAESREEADRTPEDTGRQYEAAADTEPALEKSESEVEFHEEGTPKPEQLSLLEGQLPYLEAANAPDAKKARAVLEGLLFLVGDDGITAEQAAATLDIAPELAAEYFDDLMKVYLDEDRGIEIANFGGTYRFLSKAVVHEYAKKLFQISKQATLSQAALETLAIIAYKQPITRVEIEEIRGVGADMMLRKLMARDLIRESGRSEAAGRPILYEVTEEFMNSFKLMSLKELPELPQFNETEESEDLFDQ